MRDYEEMTPRELMLYVEEYNENQRQRTKERIALAHMIAAWHPRRTNKLPRLETVFEKVDKDKPKKHEPQTPEQMLAAAMRWQKRLEKEGD